MGNKHNVEGACAGVTSQIHGAQSCTLEGVERVAVNAGGSCDFNRTAEQILRITGDIHIACTASHIVFGHRETAVNLHGVMGVTDDGISATKLVCLQVVAIDGIQEGDLLAIGVVEAANRAQRLVGIVASRHGVVAHAHGVLAGGDVVKRDLVDVGIVGTIDAGGVVSLFIECLLGVKGISPCTRRVLSET